MRSVIPAHKPHAALNFNNFLHEYQGLPTYKYKNFTKVIEKHRESGGECLDADRNLRVLNPADTTDFSFTA
jgi:hypothetical protein